MKLETIIFKMKYQMFEIFEEWGGYDHNDNIIYNLEAIDDLIEETENEDFEDIYETVLITFKWFKWVEKLRKLQENEPECLFG